MISDDHRFNLSPTGSPADDDSACTAVIIDPDTDAGRDALAQLRADARITVIDDCRQQQEALRSLVPAVEPDLLAEPTTWAYYPWRRCVVHLVGPRAFHRLRLDRNRNLISADEQQRLSDLRIGVIGLSVGHAIAHNLAVEGLCGELRLTDFDEIELPNLNRVPGTVFDLGVNKAVVAARRIAEIDPYLRVRVDLGGAQPESLGEFLDGLDVVVEECDSLDAKVLVREAARARKLPVLMATSDRGLLDVERFDLDPGRPILHGLVGDIDAARLAGLSSKDKVPHVLRILDAPQLSARMAASLVEVGKTLTTWPQLASEVVLARPSSPTPSGASASANRWRRAGCASTSAAHSTASTTHSTHRRGPRRCCTNNRRPPPPTCPASSRTPPLAPPRAATSSPGTSRSTVTGSACGC